MSKPILDNSAKAKADFKAKILFETAFIINIPGWQIADANYAAAETAFTITVSSEGVLGCVEPTCGAVSRSFGLTQTTRPLYSAHKHAVAFHAPKLRALRMFAQSGVAKKGMLS